MKVYYYCNFLDHICFQKSLIPLRGHVIIINFLYKLFKECTLVDKAISLAIDLLSSTCLSCSVWSVS